jgi:mercuric reductase
MMKVKLPIEGMTCTGCEEHVSKALKHAGAKTFLQTSGAENRTLILKRTIL